MLGELSGVFEMVGQFADDLFQADVDRARLEVDHAKADLARLERRQSAARKLMAKYRASVAKVKADQEKWAREAKKRMKKMPIVPPYPLPIVPPYPLGSVTTAFAAPGKERRAG